MMPMNSSPAPGADVEDLGVMVRGRSYMGEHLAPSTTGDGWSLYILYRDHIVKRGPWSVHEVNLQTEEVTPHYGVKAEAGQILSFPDGRIYVPAGTAIYRLNPETKSFDELSIPCSDYWYWCQGHDGFLYLCGSWLRRALRFDLKRGTFEDYGVLGHNQGRIIGRMWEYGDVTEEGEILTPLAVDSQCLYLVTGQLPRALWAMDLASHQQQMLFCITDPDQVALSQRDDGCYAVVKRPSGKEVYRLSFDAVDRIETLPVREDRPRPNADGVPQPELPETMPSPVPEIHGTGICEGDGTATVHYRPPEGDWRSVGIDLTSYPSYLFRMGPTADGRLFCSTEDPYTIFAYDTSEECAEILGPAPAHVYGFAELHNKIYFTGYSGAPLYEYDSGKQWNFRPAGPDVKTPSSDDALANPRLLGKIPYMRRAYDVFPGADDRLYLPCSAEMTGNLASGGGLGWYDPETDQMGFIREGFAFHRGCAGCTACDGRYIVVLATPWWERTIDPETSGVSERVITYDVHTKQVKGQVEPLPFGQSEVTPEHTHNACVVEWRPGKIVGRLAAMGKRGAVTVFFVLDVVTQKLEGTFLLPGRSECRLLHLPQGQLLGCHDEVIYRLNPVTWEFKTVAKLQTTPRDWGIIGGEVYAFLDTRLVRLVNIL